MMPCSLNTSASVLDCRSTGRLAPSTHQLPNAALWQRRRERRSLPAAWPCKRSAQCAARQQRTSCAAGLRAGHGAMQM